MSIKTLSRDKERRAKSRRDAQLAELTLRTMAARAAVARLADSVVYGARTSRTR